MAGRYSTEHYGEPYQIYTEIMNTGKNIEGTKRKIRWLYGFSGVEGEFEVILIQSLFSGKKTILEDGREIVSASNILASDFSHSWRSEKSSRLFRVESSTGITSEHVFNFTIDGVRFHDMPRKPTGASLNPTPSFIQKNNAVTNSATLNTKPSFSAGHNQPENNRSAYQSPANSFDPFGTSSAEPFDPFNNSVPPQPNNSFFNNPPPTTHTSGPSKTASFIAFDEPTAPATSQSNTGFAEFNHNNNNKSFLQSPPSSDPFQPPQTKTSPGEHSLPAPQQQPLKPKKSAPAPDFFNDDMAGSFIAPPAVSASASIDEDYKYGQSASASQSGKPITRRSSAQEIALDFAGIEFSPAPPQPEPVIPPPAPTEPEKSNEKIEEPIVADPWAASDLVNLDLTGKKVAPKKRSSVVDGPSLNNLLGVSNAQVGRKPSFVSPDPFGAPATPLVMGGPTPGVGMGQPMVGGGMMVAQPMGGSMGMGMGQPMPMGSGMGTRGSIGGGMMGQPMGGGMGMGQPIPGGMGMGMGQPMGGGVGMGQPLTSRGSFAGPIGGPMNGGPMRGSFYQPQQTQAPQSSLDSLNWKG